MNMEFPEAATERKMLFARELLVSKEEHLVTEECLVDLIEGCIMQLCQHALLRTMRAMTTWFCHAYASWQKGGVENANGRLRRWLPRQIDIDKVSDEEIQDIVMTAQI